jgi:hypothetical protein
MLSGVFVSNLCGWLFGCGGGAWLWGLGWACRVLFVLVGCRVVGFEFDVFGCCGVNGGLGCSGVLVFGVYPGLVVVVCAFGCVRFKLVRLVFRVCFGVAGSVVWVVSIYPVGSVRDV